MSRSPLAAFAHDVRGSLGSIRLSVGALLEDGDDDPAFRRSMLEAVDRESRRLAWCVTALPLALEHDPLEPVAIDLREAMKDAIVRVGALGLSVAYDMREAMTVEVRTDVAVEVVVALLGLVAGAEPDLVVESDDDRRLLRITGGERWSTASRLMGTLAQLLGAHVEVHPDDVSLGWRR